MESSRPNICGVLYKKSLWRTRKKKKILFGPSENLPQMLRGTTSFGQGQRLYVRLENTGEEDQVIDPNWEIGTVEVVEEEPDFPAGGAKFQGS